MPNSRNKGIKTYEKTKSRVELAMVWLIKTKSSLFLKMTAKEKIANKIKKGKKYLLSV